MSDSEVWGKGRSSESGREVPQHQKGVGWSSVGTVILHGILGRWLEPHWGSGWGGVEWPRYTEGRWTPDIGALSSYSQA